MNNSPSEVLDFWFKEIDLKQHWVKDPEFDALIANRFGKLHTQANACELFTWRDTAEGSLAEIIVLDQFSRNMYRDTPQAFASDALALALSQTAVAKGFDAQLTEQQRPFLYMPYMHSESAVVHEQAVMLFEKVGQNSLDFELKHKVIIDRFGRYPHRNAILGRESTPEEVAFLNEPNSSF